MMNLTDRIKLLASAIGSAIKNLKEDRDTLFQNFGEVSSKVNSQETEIAEVTNTQKIDEARLSVLVNSLQKDNEVGNDDYQF